MLPPSGQLRLLLVEDSSSDAHILRAELDELEGEPIRMERVDRLAAALERLSGGGFDAVLLDLGLPDSSGIETLRAVRQRAETVPVVVLTGLHDEGLGLEAIREGAQDYLIKGQIPGDLLARSIRYAVERTHLEQKIRRTNEEFRVARTIQESLFPRSAPHVPGFEIAGRSQPADATGGDYFDYLAMPGGHQGIVVSDVCGHGYGPAILMAEVRAYLRALAEVTSDAGEILTRANHLLTKDTPDERFAALFLARISPAQRTLVYAAAGDRAFLLRGDGRIERLPATGVPLGIDSDAVIPCSPPIDLAVGDVLLLLTDGLIETMAPDGSQFGEEGVCAVALASRHLAARPLIDALFAAAAAFAREEPQRDDFTAVVIKVAG